MTTSQPPQAGTSGLVAVECVVPRQPRAGLRVLVGSEHEAWRLPALAFEARVLAAP